MKVVVIMTPVATTAKLYPRYLSLSTLLILILTPASNPYVENPG